MKFNFRLSIGYKLSFAFGILTILLIYFSISTYSNLQRNKDLTYTITNQYIKSEKLLNELISFTDNAQILTKTWVYIDRRPETTDKKKLRWLLVSHFPDLKSKLDLHSKNWTEENQKNYRYSIGLVQDTLIPKMKLIMQRFGSMESYNEENLRIGFQDIKFLMAKSDEASKKIIALRDVISQKTIEGYNDMDSSFKRFQSFTIFISIFIVVFAIVIATYTTRDLLLPIIKIKNELRRMSMGILEKKQHKKRNDELGEMLEALEKLNNGLIDTSNFSLEIGKGNYNVEYSPMSKDDSLGNSLLTLRDNLEKATKDTEERKKIDYIQNWATNGLAKFADLLRTNNENIKQLGKVVINNLVKYMNINQGGLFVLNDEDKENIFLDLVAVYAYDREKFAQKHIKEGEGLVGTCYLEKETVYLTEVPESYITITSGLGKANPKSVLIVPLKMEEQVLGVLELASFNKFQEHEIEFVERIAESLASTITNARINERTSELLKQSEVQADAMKQQEEEMRQNMEEMLSTQEEAYRKEEELRNELEQAKNEIEHLKSRINDIG